MKELEMLAIKINELIDLIKSLGLPIDEEKLNLLSNDLTSQLSDIEKSLKALEIFKEKCVDIASLYVCFERYDLETFNRTVIYARGEQPLTQEEYDLLKEVLL